MLRYELNFGDIVFQNMDANNGLSLKNVYATRNKYFVIVGKKSKGDAIDLCLFNSNLDFYKNNPNRQKYQYTLKRADYLGKLEMDSRLDCAELFTLQARQNVFVKAKVVGHLTSDDEDNVMPLVASYGFIDVHRRECIG